MILNFQYHSKKDIINTLLIVKSIVKETLIIKKIQRNTYYYFFIF